MMRTGQLGLKEMFCEWLCHKDRLVSEGPMWEEAQEHGHFQGDPWRGQLVIQLSCPFISLKMTRLSDVDKMFSLNSECQRLLGTLKFKRRRAKIRNYIILKNKITTFLAKKVMLFFLYHQSLPVQYTVYLITSHCCSWVREAQLCLLISLSVFKTKLKHHLLRKAHHDHTSHHILHCMLLS